MEVLVTTLPVSLYLSTELGVVREFDPFNMWLSAVVAMILVGTVVRLGWLRPLFSASLGWVRLRSPLVALRLVAFNLVVLVAVYGGLAVADIAGAGAVGWLLALAVGAGTMAVFPRVAESVMTRIDQ